MPRMGEIRRDPRRVRKALFRSGAAWEQAEHIVGGRRMSIHVHVGRTYKKGGAFSAQACMLSRASWLRQYRTTRGPSRIGYKRKHERCAESQGGTPTRAVKRAVTSLMKKIR